jgi:hypothetical protein
MGHLRKKSTTGFTRIESSGSTTDERKDVPVQDPPKNPGTVEDSSTAKSLIIVDGVVRREG